MQRSDRLDRRYPGEGLQEPTSLAVRLSVRDREPAAARPMCGEQMTVRDVKVRRTRRFAETAPNAPLLKRLVRYPFVQEVTRGRREAVSEVVPWAALRREPARPPMTDALEWMGPIVWGNPLKAFPTRLEVRPRASVDAWLRGAR